MSNLTITTNGLTRRFGSLTAVDTLNMEVPQGSVYGFLGPNGAGKTTTIRMLLGLIQPHHGQVELFGQALPRWAIYAAKQAAGIFLIGLSLLAMGGFLVVAGLAMRVVKPEVGFGPTIPWGDLFTYLGLIFLGSWLVTAIQTWVSVRWPSFALASAVGIVMTVSGAMVIHAEWGRLWPWALPAMLFNEFRAGETILSGLLVGSLGGVAAAITGG